MLGKERRDGKVGNKGSKRALGRSEGETSMW